MLNWLIVLGVVVVGGIIVNVLYYLLIWRRR